MRYCISPKQAFLISQESMDRDDLVKISEAIKKAAYEGKLWIILKPEEFRFKKCKRILEEMGFIVKWTIDESSNLYISWDIEED